MKKVFLVILNYNGESDTLELLNSLKKVNRSGFMLYTVLVDNLSKSKINIDPSDFKELNLHLIFNNKNLGFSGGNNVGIRYSLRNGADYVIILNNDTLADPDFIKELINVSEINEKCGVVCPKILFSKGYEFHKDKYKDSELGRVIWYAGGKMDWKNVIGVHRGVDEVDNHQFDTITQTELATGCCLLINKDVFEKIGDYDERYFLYFEDADFSERVKKAGFKIYYAPKAIIWHKNAQSSGGSGSDLQDYYITRNRLLFGFRFAPIRTKLALFRESLKFIFKGRKWQKKGVLDYFTLKLGKGNFIDKQ